MIIIAVFVALVFLYSLVSRRLEHTVITAPIVFTSARDSAYLRNAGIPSLNMERESLLKLAEMGLVMLLFTDATHISLKKLKSRERLPLRLLSIGMLLTILLGAVAAHLVFPQLSIWETGILAAILAPTDAGLGQVIVRSPRVPLRIRQSLDVEAGLNDGLSVPFLLFFIAVSRIGTEGAGAVLLNYVFEQLGMGALVGLTVGLIGGTTPGRSPTQGVDGRICPAAWPGGVANPQRARLRTCWREYVHCGVCRRPGRTGRLSGRRHTQPRIHRGMGTAVRLLCLFLIRSSRDHGIQTVQPFHALYAVLSLTVVRMVPVAIALIGTRLSSATVLFMGWFGPRGLASIVLGLVYLEEEAQLPGEETIKLAVMVTVMLSIFAHGFSALPGIDLYARKVAGLDASTPEKRE